MTTTTLGSTGMVLPGSSVATRPGGAWRSRALVSRRPAPGRGDELVCETGRPAARRPCARAMEDPQPLAVKAARHDDWQRDGCHANFLHREVSLRQECEQRPAGEEPQVGAVQDAAVSVVEATRKKRQAHPEMRDVGHR